MTTSAASLSLAWLQNACGDAECEQRRLAAAIQVLTGAPDDHDHFVEAVEKYDALRREYEASEDAWRDGAGTEAIRKANPYAHTSPRGTVCISSIREDDGSCEACGATGLLT